MFVSGIERAARPVGAVRDVERPDLAVLAADDRRREQRTDLVLRHDLQRLGLELGREVDDVALEEALALERRRLGRERLRRRVPLGRHLALFDRPLFDRPHRLAGHAIEDVEEALLGRLRDRLDRLSVHRDVREDRRARNVVVPDRVVDELEVPEPLARSRGSARPGSRRTDCCRDDARRSSRRSGSRPAGRRCRAPRRRSAASRRRCGRCTTRNRSASVSLPNSPGTGMVWKIHSRLPVRAS